MRPFVTCEQMKLLEKLADESGLSYYQMMENAGTQAFHIISSDTFMPENKHVMIFCGKGNNGGDGFVAARKFHELGARVTVVLVDGEPVTPDAITNYLLIRKKVRIITMKNFDRFDNAHVIIDAIYGTGFHGQLRSSALDAIQWINRQPASIYALDIPSGLGGDADSLDSCDKEAIRAHHTITFHNIKPVHIQPFADPYCGEIHIADIGIDENKFHI